MPFDLDTEPVDNSRKLGVDSSMMATEATATREDHHGQHDGHSIGDEIVTGRYGSSTIRAHAEPPAVVSTLGDRGGMERAMSQETDDPAVGDITASARHERVKLEAVRATAAALEAAVETERRARELRDQAVRAAVKAGVPPGQVAVAAGLSAGRVSHITMAPRS